MAMVYHLGIDVGTSSVKITAAREQEWVVDGGSDDKENNHKLVVLNSWQQAYDYSQPKYDEKSGGVDAFISAESPPSSMADEKTVSGRTAQSDGGRDRFMEQDAGAIINSVFRCLHQAMRVLRSLDSFKLKRIAVCGQMHGVILWSHGNILHRYYYFINVLS